MYGLSDRLSGWTLVKHAPNPTLDTASSKAGYTLSDSILHRPCGIQPGVGSLVTHLVE